MTAEALRAGLAAGLGTPVRGMTPVSGGCISAAYRARLEDGTLVFVKTAPAPGGAEVLRCEAHALRRMAATGAVRVPGVLAEDPQWLALEWLEPAPGTTADWAALGRGLAQLHRHSADRYGWDQDNFIGSLPQANAWTVSWPEFWRRHRLEPQLESAAPRLSAGAGAAFRQLLDQLDARLGAAGDEAPSLLHGDLWNGNVHMTSAGPALIDPSGWYGHREVDLAMADLFGGFPRAFHDAYRAEWPLLPGAEARTPIYQLYYLLVHVNLFGDAYVARTEATVHAALG